MFLARPVAGDSSKACITVSVQWFQLNVKITVSDTTSLSWNTTYYGVSRFHWFLALLHHFLVFFQVVLRFACVVCNWTTLPVFLTCLMSLIAQPLLGMLFISPLCARLWTRITVCMLWGIYGIDSYKHIKD